MLQNGETTEYTPDQVMRYHGVRLHHQAHRLSQAMALGGLPFLQDSMNLVFSGIELDENADIQGMSRDRGHYRQTIKALEKDHLSIKRREHSLMSGMALQLVNRCILECMGVLDLMDNYPGLTAAEDRPGQGRQTGNEGEGP